MRHRLRHQTILIGRILHKMAPIAYVTLPSAMEYDTCAMFECNAHFMSSNSVPNAAAPSPCDWWEKFCAITSLVIQCVIKMAVCLKIASSDFFSLT